MDLEMADFENNTFNPFKCNTSKFSDENDPDENYFNDVNQNSFDTNYLYQENIHEVLNKSEECENLSLLHLNIRSMNSNFGKFKHFWKT